MKLLPMLIILFTLAGCVTVHERDQTSIDNWGELDIVYTEDLARAAGKESETTLTEKDFPIGKLTWDEYKSTKGLIASKKSYEESKQSSGK